MIALREQVHQVHKDLFSGNSILIEEAGHRLAIAYHSELEQICFKVLIYSGDAFIPLSIRKAVEESQTYPALFMTLCPENARVFLHAKWGLSRTSEEEVLGLLEDFIGQAEQWQQRLQDLDGQDLVYVRNR